jgi:hypothetical protein
VNGVLSFLGGYTNGDEWEKLCVSCYRLRYQDFHYTAIPAVHGGDAGIEGFTLNGIVHQCYCAERTYSDNELYKHQRDKMTEDIDKLAKNAKCLKDLGVPPVIEWHFSIPDYRDFRILKHAESKRIEVLNGKKLNPPLFEHVADGFRILVKTADDFLPEISKIVRIDESTKISLAFNSDEPDWSKCDSQKAENIRRKTIALRNTIHVDQDAKFVIFEFTSNYIKYIEQMAYFRRNFPEIFESFNKLLLSYKNKVSIDTRINTDRSMNQKLFSEIVKELQDNIDKGFSKMIAQNSLMDMTQGAIASWLADCSMEFRRG